MKRIIIFSTIIIAFLGISSLISGCSLAGLSLQKDYNRSLDDTIDAHVYKTAWGYLKARAYGSQTDTIFRRMYDGIIYSGIDTNEYTKPGRTYIFLQNNTIINITKNSSGVVTSKTGLWISYTNNGAQATSWASYSKADVKNYLSYLILLGTYTHTNLPVTKDSEYQTLAPAGAYTTNPITFKAPGTFNPNPKSTMMVHVSDANTVTSQLDYPIVLNQTTNIDVSDLLATNGVIDVIRGTNTVPFFFPAP